jgi:hypothetical protein
VAFVASYVIDKAIVCDFVQKSREFRRRTVAIGGLDDFAPHLLKDVVGVVAVSAKPQQIAVQRVVMTSIQGFEGVNVAILETQHQGAVFGR